MTELYRPNRFLSADFFQGVLVDPPDESVHALGFSKFGPIVPHWLLPSLSADIAQFGSRASSDHQLSYIKQIVLVLLTVALRGWSQEEPADMPRVAVNVYNDAGVAEPILAEGKRGASQIEVTPEGGSTFRDKFGYTLAWRSLTVLSLLAALG